MTPGLWVSSSLMALFLLAALAWSAHRVMVAPTRWRIVHLGMVLSMLAGGGAFWANHPPIGLLAGLCMVLLSLGSLLAEKAPFKVLAMVQFLSGLLLAAGLPFTLR